MIACNGSLASRSVAFSGPGGSANVARSAKKTRDVWRDTPSGAMVHSSDSDIALSSCVSTPSRARHPCPSGSKLLTYLPICPPPTQELPCAVETAYVAVLNDASRLLDGSCYCLQQK